MLLREVPFLRIGLPLCAGILFGHYIDPGPVFYFAPALIIISGFILSAGFNKQLYNPLYGASFISAMFISGMLLYTREKASISELRPEEGVFTGYLTDYPEEKEKTWKIILKLESDLSGQSPSPVRGSLLVYHRKENGMLPWVPGDRLTIRCRPSEIENKGNPYEFDYKFYMENRGVRYLAFTSGTDIISHSSPDRRKLRQRALIIRQNIIDMFRERGLKEERLALVAAITLGQKNMLDPEQKQYFIKAGIMHVMAVSGLHAMILSLFVLRVLFFLRGKLRILRVIAALAILWCFAFVTGLTPSVFRATLMFSFLQAGTLMKRPVNPVNSILASAFVLIMIRPSVIFDVSFLLSYSAVTFIIIFYRDLYKKIQIKRRIPDLIWQSAAVSLIAQAGTLSLTVALFNRFPTWFILSNIVIVPIASLVIIAGCLMPLLYPLKFLSLALVKLLGFIAWMTEYLTARAASLPYSTIDNIGMTTVQCILLTITIFLIMRFLLARGSLPASVPLTALLLLVAAGTIKAISTRTSSELIVYNSQGISTVGLRNGKHLVVWCDTVTPGQEVLKHASTLGLDIDIRQMGSNPLMVDFRNKKIVMTSFINPELLDKTKPDIVIVKGKNLSINPAQRPVAGLKTLIVGSGSTVSYQNSRILRSMGIDTLHFTRNTGAFRLSL